MASTSPSDEWNAGVPRPTRSAEWNMWYTPGRAAARLRFLPLSTRTCASLLFTASVRPRNDTPGIHCTRGITHPWSAGRPSVILRRPGSRSRRMQVALCRGERAVPGDLPQDVHGNASAVTHLVSICCVTEDSGGDPAAAGTREQPIGGVRTGRSDPSATSSRTSTISGTAQARLPLAPLSTSPPGEGVVCRRTGHVQDDVSTPPTRTPATSPMQPAGHAA